MLFPGPLRSARTLLAAELGQHRRAAVLGELGQERRHLLLGRGEMNTGGADKSSILADGVESLLGAVYLHHGIEVAREVILRLFGSLLDTAPTLGAGLDWKTSLQELTAARNLGPPSYVVTSTGPDHDKEFTAVVVVMETEYGTGIGRSKKEAEQRAAAAAWNALESA